MLADRLVQAVVVSRRFLTTCVLLLVVEGCQQRPTTVSGTVTLDGKPLSIASDSRGTVVFQPVGGHGTMATGVLDSAGHFKLATGASPDVAPGKYQVSVSVVQFLPKSEGVEQGAERITPAKYASASESGLQANVAPGENRLSFDLSSTDNDGSSSSPNLTSSSSSSSSSNDPQPAQSATGNN